MSEPNTPKAPKPLKEPLEDLQRKFSVKYQEIQMAEGVVKSMHAEAGAIGDQILTYYGKNATITVPDPARSGFFRGLVITFQRVAKAVRFEALDVTDLMGLPKPPAAPASDPMSIINGG